MGGFSLTHWLVVMLVIVLLFGAGKLPRLMGDLASGIKNFKRSLNEDAGAEDSPAVSASAEQPRPVESR